MNIPLTDLKLQYKNLKNEIGLAINEALSESNFILGNQVTLLEEEIAKHLEVKYAVGVASGTDALVLSLTALGIGNGDEVITTPFTFIATAEAICRVGAKPVFCDIEYDTYNIDTNKIEAKITKRTKAIISVHLYGLACEINKISSIAKAYNLKVIEDCAQSFGSEYEGKKVGSFGDCGALSFFPAKTLGCYGDGGMVITNDENIAEKIKMLRNHGSTAKYFYSMHGFNSRLDTLQAVVLLVKMKYIDEWIDKRLKAANLYNKLLSDIPDVKTPFIPERAKHTFNYYTIRIKAKRDLLQKHLKEEGIACAIYYPLCLHLQEVYKELGFKPGDFPIAEQAQGEVLSLPMYPELYKGQIAIIGDVIKKTLN